MYIYMVLISQNLQNKKRFFTQRIDYTLNSRLQHRVNYE